jgi:hypothetical protein
LTLRVRTITLAPGSERPFDEDEWRDALVLVERGRIERRGVAVRRR